MKHCMRLNKISTGLMLLLLALWGAQANALSISGVSFRWFSLDTDLTLRGANQNGYYDLTEHIFSATVDFICDNPQDKKTYQAESAVQSYTFNDTFYPSEFDGNGNVDVSYVLDLDNPDQVELKCHQKRFQYVPETAIISEFYVLLTAKRCTDSSCTEFKGMEDELQYHCKFPLDIEMLRDPSTGVLDSTYKGTEYQCTEIYLPD